MASDTDFQSTQDKITDTKNIYVEMKSVLEPTSFLQELVRKSSKQGRLWCNALLWGTYTYTSKYLSLKKEKHRAGITGQLCNF